jgi:AraC-like DNA-binding protein
MNVPLFQRWTHDVPATTRAPVYPDGCRDVLILRRPGARPEVRLTPFDLRPRLVALTAGSALQGFRLRPGAAISARALQAIDATPDQAEAIIRSDLALSVDVGHAIRALTLPGTTVGDTARDLGLSPRSLQRLFHGLDLPPPDYWRLLSRARRAAAELAGPMPLAAIAADCGFSDQAHLTRETLRWFGQTPRQMRRDGATLSLLAQPALGNWSAET